MAPVKDATPDNSNSLGFLYHVFDFLFDKLYWINLVELVKFITALTLRCFGFSERAGLSIGVDVYQVLKWGLVLWLLLTER